MKATAELKAADRNPYSGNILWTQEILTATADTERKEVNDMIKTTMKIDGMMCGMCEAPTMKIDGMMCGMCEAHICDTIRKAVPAAKKVSASRRKKEATFLTETAADAAALKEAIDATGYTCLGIESAPYEKKGLFG